MKKILAFVLAVVMLFSIVACNSSTNDVTDNGEKVYNIGICQLVQHPALDEATKGFRDALTEKLGDKGKFDEQNASGEATNCTTITSKFVSDKVDLIMANATDALTAASQATDTIPIVATSITDYATALSITDWNGKTGFNVTGTSDLAPLAEQAKMIKELVPTAKNVGILYCSAEKNSKYQADVMTAELKAMGINVKEYTFVDTNDVNSVTQSIVNDKCDAVFVPTDNTAASNTEAINNVLEPAKIPVIAGEAGICSGCGIATLSISYYDLGYITGEMAYEILVNGKDPAEMDIQFADAPEKMYLKSRADALGITVPEGYAPLEEA
ncbi:MAG: ABC transporter substrate-binding protein [Clostridia bacterium]|nr:ABC transporter substrate-binding protein [Clostridia bacterium]